MSDAIEVNFDGLVGPTHNYAGLSLGNRASMEHAGEPSRPKEAARQGIEKMRALRALGLTQGVIPPLQRPDPLALEQLGFSSDTPLADVAAHASNLVAALMSASSMWSANAATVSPSSDTADQRVHFTPANLNSTLHRSIEHYQMGGVLGAIFADPSHFVVHPALPGQITLSDEGAANYGRLAKSHADPGLALFVYGRDADEPLTDGGFPRRQSRLASERIAASHQLDPQRTVFARQSPVAINAGAFHNDVVSVLNESVVFAHEDAFAEPAALYQTLQVLVPETKVVEVPRDDVPLADAVSSYLFNSQLVTLPDASMVLIAPSESEETPSTAAYLQTAVADPNNPISGVKFMNLRQSMHNGGGPACLRLRVVLSPSEQAAVSGRCLVDDETLDALDSWVERHYREELSVDDLLDPNLIDEEQRALDELTNILGLGALYPFQR